MSPAWEFPRPSQHPATHLGQVQPTSRWSSRLTEDLSHFVSFSSSQKISCIIPVSGFALVLRCHHRGDFGLQIGHGWQEVCAGEHWQLGETFEGLERWENDDEPVRKDEKN